MGCNIGRPEEVLGCGIGRPEEESDFRKPKKFICSQYDPSCRGQQLLDAVFAHDYDAAVRALDGGADPNFRGISRAMHGVEAGGVIEAQNGVHRYNCHELCVECRKAWADEPEKSQDEHRFVTKRQERAESFPPSTWKGTLGCTPLGKALDLVMANESSEFPSKVPSEIFHLLLDRGADVLQTRGKLATRGEFAPRRSMETLLMWPSAAGEHLPDECYRAILQAAQKQGVERELLEMTDRYGFNIFHKIGLDKAGSNSLSLLRMIKDTVSLRGDEVMDMFMDLTPLSRDLAKFIVGYLPPIPGIESTGVGEFQIKAMDNVYFQKFTPLQALAIRCGKPQSAAKAKILIEMGADPNFRIPKDQLLLLFDDDDKMLRKYKVVAMNALGIARHMRKDGSAARKPGRRFRRGTKHDPAENFWSDRFADAFISYLETFEDPDERRSRLSRRKSRLTGNAKSKTSPLLYRLKRRKERESRD